MSFDIDLADGKVHELALYFLDWDNQGRVEQVQVVNSASQAVLYSRTISGFQNGQYLVLNLKGHVTVQITLTSGVNAVLSGLFFDPVKAAASFVRVNTTEQGTWKTVYGLDGEAINGDSSNYPAYAQVNFTGATPFVWAASGTDVRDLQKAAASDRIASGWYTSSTMSIDVNLTDGNTHRVALYFLDWDKVGRTEQLKVLDSVSQAVLFTQTISGFGNGEYQVLNLSGHVTLRITAVAGPNAVISGLFFDPVMAAASFMKTDVTTQGTWKGVYGSDGGAINGDLEIDPNYAQVSLSGGTPFVWVASATDVRDLQKAAASDRIASGWYTNTNMSLDVSVADGNSHSVALYFLDWDNLGRTERVDVLNAASQTILDTRTVTGFQNGKYLVWNVRGHVTFKITLTGGANAVLGGFFFGPPQSGASFVGANTATQGTWKTVYGADGEAINGDSVNYPFYAQVNFSGADPFVWAASGTDVRDLQKAAASDRIASGWYTGSNMSIDVNLMDGNAHNVALYFLDWDYEGRIERVEVLDASSQAILDTRTVSGFQNGEYLVWNLTGHVTFRITLTGGINAVVSGLFFH